MTIRSAFFLIVLLFCSVHIVSAQTTDFPASWEGDWKGKLEVFNAKGKAHEVEMTIEIHQIDTSTQGRYTFSLIYGSKDKDWRPYEIMPVDPAKGLWRVDEKNSIAMESYLYGPKLLCWFVVEGSRVLCVYEKISPTQMVFEVMAGNETPVSKTGDTMQGEEKIPPVVTYPFSAYQRAVLTRL